MTISEEQLMRHLDSRLSSSEPGAELHHLHVVAAPRGPLGLPDSDQTKTTIYALLPQFDTAEVLAGELERFIRRAIAAAAVEHEQRGDVIVFAGLSQEAWVVLHMDALGGQLQAEGRLEEHPNAVEATMIYAACNDGRRWTGRRYLTGGAAGETENVRMLVGKPDAQEGHGVPAAILIRRLVGI